MVTCPFFVYVSSLVQPTADSSDGPVQLNHPHLSSGEHHMSLQVARVSEPGGSAALRHHHQVSFQLSSSPHSIATTA